MTSDPFKLVNDRMFKEMREHAQRDRLVQSTRSATQPSQHGRLRMLAAEIRTRLQTRRRDVRTTTSLKGTEPLPR
jgi:hypothetical protein